MLEALSKLVNNTTNMFLILPSIISFYISFIKYLWMSKILVVLIGLKSTEKTFTLFLHML